MKKFKISRSVIPNSFTAMNAFCGFTSMVYSRENDFQLAAVFIIIAAIFDALDGIMARLTKSSSQFGVELDSLADVVSFGAAPSFLIYSSFFFDYEYKWLGIVISSLPLICGALRLARFNVQLTGFDKSSFSGLPIPFQAFALSSYVMIYYSPESGFREPYINFIVPLVLFLSALMVSRIKFNTLPKFSKKGVQSQPLYYLFLVIALILAIVSRGSLLFIILMSVIFYSILRHIFKYFFPNLTLSTKKNRR